MRFENKMAPDEEQMNGFIDEPDKGPISMVNLLKFKDKAEYEDGRETDLTGREAYAIYGMGVSQLMPEYGARAIFSGPVSRLSYGEIDDLWDMIAIATYPNRKAMLDMITSPKYLEFGVHRTAGLEGQLNIETLAPGAIPHSS